MKRKKKLGPKSKKQKWDMLNDHPFFFRDLPWVKGARAMFQYVQYVTPLTGYVPGIMSVVYFCQGDVRKGLYWFAATLLTASVTF